MFDWVSIACPACGRAIKVPAGRPILACGQCGTELVIGQTGEAVTLAPLVEALSRLDGEASAAGDTTHSNTKAEILDLLSEIDQLWLERRHDLLFSLRLMVVASLGLLLAIVVDVGWLRWIGGLVAAGTALPGLWGLFDHFIGKSKEARRRRLELALIALWSTLTPSAPDSESGPSAIPPNG
jgi:hypothetical protein